MNIQYANQKIIRFDINENSLKNRMVLDKFDVNLRYEYGIDNVPENHIWIGLRITTHIVEKISKKEVVGYIFEYRGVAKPNNKDLDIVDLELFIRNALLNYQYYFQENAPKVLSSNQLINRPKEKEYTKNFMDFLCKAGVYNE